VPGAATATAVDRLRRRAILFEQLVAVAPVVGAADGVGPCVGEAARDLRSSLTRLGRHDPAGPSLAAAEANRAAQALRCSAERPVLDLDHRAAAVA
jgi:hypothetical protein